MLTKTAGAVPLVVPADASRLLPSAAAFAFTTAVLSFSFAPTVLSFAFAAALALALAFPFTAAVLAGARPVLEKLGASRVVRPVAFATALAANVVVLHRSIICICRHALAF